MQLHELQPKYKRKQRKRVGRGGKRGTYSGRGVKGQKSRAGRRLKPSIRGFIKRYPKLRGYRFKFRVSRTHYSSTVPTQHTAKFQIVNLDILEKKFQAGETVNPQVLLEKRIIRRIKGRVPNVKILSEGKLTKKLTIEGCAASKSAREKIEEVGGTIK
ncbi:MAG: 50S ribosomal protein L15 [Candidatus Nealsonbacteria bacterium]|nr:MAG: 50S ribosomal protein L15 [Candidatus Nealsonbacteria bacterium]